MREKGESAFDDVVQEDDDEDTSKPTGGDSVNKSSSGSNATTDANGDGSVSESDSAFPYADVTQQPMYARGETWDQLEDMKYYAEGELREQFGIRNAETREFDEAIVQLLLDEIPPEKIAEKIVEIRGFDP